MNNGCMMNCTICCLCIRAVDFLVALYAISLKQQSIGLIITVSSACLEPEEVRHCMLSGMRCDILEQMKYPKTMFAILLSFNQTQKYGSVCHNKTTTKFSLNSSKTRFSMSYLLWQQPGQLVLFPDPAQLSIASSTVSGRGPALQKQVGCFNHMQSGCPGCRQTGETVVVRGLL